MSLYAKFSLTPLESFKEQIDWDAMQYSYIAYMSYYGVRLDYMGPYSLPDCCRANWALLTTNPLPYPFPDPLPSDWYKHAVARLRFTTNEEADKQYLLLFHLYSLGDVAFYINGNLVKVEQLQGPETVAILVDCPGPLIYEYVYVAPRGGAAIKGVDCYIL